MMSSTVLLITLLCLVSALGSPLNYQVTVQSPLEITSTPWCDGLSGGAFGIAHNFTLVAYNTTKNLSEPVAVPLALKSIAGAELRLVVCSSPDSPAFVQTFLAATRVIPALRIQHFLSRKRFISWYALRCDRYGSRCCSWGRVQFHNHIS